MKIPTLQEAELLLIEGEKMNPGPWIAHSNFAAQAARHIAACHPDMDASCAYILGYMHDIGRRTGVTQMRHIFDGYNFLIDKGYDDAARICLTHSFPYKDTNSAFGKWDCYSDERKFIDTYICNIEYNNYDRLIQLCDYLSMPSGFCIIEKRMIDVALRYGTNEYAISKWKSLFEIKESFDKAIGRSVYEVLPGIVQNTLK